MNDKQKLCPSVEEFNENVRSGDVRKYNHLHHTDKSIQFGLTNFLEAISKKRNNALGFLIIFTIFVLLLYLIIESKDHREF